MADATFSDGDSLKIDSFFFFFFVELDLNVSYLPINCIDLVKSMPFSAKSVLFGNKI